MNRQNFIGLSAAVASLAASSRANGGRSERPIISFGLITDVQYADADPEGERYYRDSIQKLEVAVAWLATKKLSFTLHLGDLIDRDFKAFGTVLPLLDGLEHPVHHLLGNHDYSVAEGHKEQVRSTLGMPHDYYSFKAAGARIVLLDTNDLSVYKYSHGCPKDLESSEVLATRVAENDSSAEPWNGGLSATQLAWLERELSQADGANERVIVCGHHPLLPEDSYQLWNHQAVIDVMDRHPCVIAFFNGHPRLRWPLEFARGIDGCIPSSCLRR